ncbi:MAG: futalosine hydrolase [Nitrospirota bacterium]
MGTRLIAIISSMAFESVLVLSSMKGVRSHTAAGKSVHKGRLFGLDTVLMISGMGKVNAAHSAAYLIEKYPVGSIINIGVGGAYSGSGLRSGDLAIASKEIFGDEGVIDSRGWGGLEKIGIPLVQKGKKRYFNEYPAARLSGIISAGSVRRSSRDFLVREGSFVTVSAASGAKKRAKELEVRFNAICENMEGAAIAQVCALYEIPMVEIRGISNIAGIRDKRTWDLGRASENCQKYILDIFSAASCCSKQ